SGRRFARTSSSAHASPSRTRGPRPTPICIRSARFRAGSGRRPRPDPARGRVEIAERAAPIEPDLVGGVLKMSIRRVWLGDGAPRMEVAHVEQAVPAFVAAGTQLGVTYELRYRLENGRLHLELVGERTLDLELEGADFFDLGWSPLFNSLPVLRDRLLHPG